MEELSLIQEGYFRLKEGGFLPAKELFTQALAKEEDAGAYIGLLLADNALSTEDQLPELPRPLSSYKEFSDALSCADAGYKTVLENYAQAQEPILQKKEEKYAQLLSGVRADHQSEEAIDALIRQARELKGYRDSAQIKERLEREREELQNEAKAKKKKRRMILIPVVVLIAAALIAAGLFLMLPKVGQVRYALTLNGYVAFSCDGDAEEVTVADTVFGVRVTKIDSKAFKNCERLTSVTLGANVDTIGKSAFNKCFSLKTVKGTEHVRLVMENAFKDCSSLRKISFPENCEIDRDAFRDCDEDLTVFVGDKKWQRPKGNDESAAERAYPVEIVTKLTKEAAVFMGK